MTRERRAPQGEEMGSKPMNQAGYLELLDQTDQKHDAAHQRLREAFRDLETRNHEALGLLRDVAMANKAKLAELVATPIDATKLVMTPKIVASIVFVVVGLSGGMWASTSGLRSDMRDISTQMKSEQRVTDANAKLLEVNNTTIKAALESNAKEMKESIATITRRQELQQLQIVELKESILRLTTARR